MIAANYLKHPDALRFQRELFHNGYKNSPRIMRLMECVFKFAPDVPGWAKEAARKARQLVKVWKAAQIGLNFKSTTQATTKNNPRFTPNLTPCRYSGRVVAQGSYRWFCERCKNWASDRMVYQYKG